MELERREDDNRIRVSDSEREAIVALLTAAAGEGRLTLEEYNERAGAAYAAKTRGEIIRLGDDLPAARQAPMSPATGSKPEHLVAIFGNESRKGSWLVPALVEAKSVFGDCHIELQEAQLAHPVTTFEVQAIFGSVTIFAPEGMDVRLTGRAIFGSKESKLHGPVKPGTPVVNVNCRVVFGSVTVRPPKRRWW